MRIRMTKSDLRTGNVVKLGTGKYYIVMKDVEMIQDSMFNQNGEGHLSLDKFDENLRYEKDYLSQISYDVEEVYMPIGIHALKQVKESYIPKEFFSKIWERDKRSTRERVIEALEKLEDSDITEIVVENVPTINENDYYRGSLAETVTIRHRGGKTELWD